MNDDFLKLLRGVKLPHPDRVAAAFCGRDDGAFAELEQAYDELKEKLGGCPLREVLGCQKAKADTNSDGVSEGSGP